MKLTFSQIEQLWIDNGGSTALAPIMAAVAMAESGGETGDYNGTAGPPAGSGATWVGHSPTDESYGLWQINYKGSMLQSRTARWGSPTALVQDPNLQAKAAVQLAGNGTGLSNWSTWSNGAYKAYLPAGMSGATGTSNGTGTAGSGVQLISEVELGPKPDPNAAKPKDEGHWHIGTGVIGFDIERRSFRKAGGFLVLLGGGVVMLLGTGWIVKGSVIQAVTKPIAGALQGRTQRRSAVAKEQTRQEGLAQRQDMREQRRRQRESESSPSPFESEEPF